MTPQPVKNTPPPKKAILVPKRIIELKKAMNAAEINHIRLVSLMCEKRTQESMNEASAAFREFEQKRIAFAKEIQAFKSEKMSSDKL
jgi:hypothetical protein